MKAPAKINRQEVREIEGRTCLVFIGKDGAGRPVEMAMPADGLNSVFTHADRLVTAYQAQKSREEIGGLFSVISSRGVPCMVVPFELEAEDAVALVVRKGEPTELVLRYSTQDARDLGNELVRVADMIDRDEKPPLLTN